jgi:hypothetical protein
METTDRRWLPKRGKVTNGGIEFDLAVFLNLHGDCTKTTWRIRRKSTVFEKLQPPDKLLLIHSRWIGQLVGRVI